MQRNDEGVRRDDVHGDDYGGVPRHGAYASGLRSVPQIQIRASLSGVIVTEGALIKKRKNGA